MDAPSRTERRPPDSIAGSLAGVVSPLGDVALAARGQARRSRPPLWRLALLLAAGVSRNHVNRLGIPSGRQPSSLASPRCAQHRRRARAMSMACAVSGASPPQGTRTRFYNYFDGRFPGRQSSLRLAGDDNSRDICNNADQADASCYAAEDFFVVE